MTRYLPILALLISASCGGEENNDMNNAADTGAAGDMGSSADTSNSDVSGADDTGTLPDSEQGEDMPAAVDMGSTGPLATDCPDSPDDNTICATVEGIGTQVFVMPAGNVLTGSTEEDADLQDNMTIQIPLDTARSMDCSLSDGTLIIVMNLGINAFAGDDTTEAWIVGNTADGYTCDFEVTIAAPNSGDTYEGRFSATMVRLIGIAETDPTQTLRIAGTFRGTRP